MKIKLIIVFLFFPFLSYSQWQGKLYDPKEEIAFWKTMQFISDKEAFCANESNKIFKTKDNWKTYEVINIEIPIAHSIEYLYFYGKNKGIIIIKNNLDNSLSSGYVLVTENGGYEWNIAFEIPYKTLHLNSGAGTELFHCKVKNGKLALLYGDLICWGNLNGKNWTFERLNWLRQNVNDGFHFINDSSFVILNLDSNMIKINGQWTSNCPNYSLSLGNGFQYASDQYIKEFSFYENKWNDIVSRNDFSIREVKQLSENLAVIKYYDWRISKNQFVVFNYQMKSFVELFSSDTLINSDLICNKDSTFIVKIRQDYFKSNNYGVTWSKFNLGTLKGYFGSTPQAAFNENIQFYSSRYGEMLFSRDSCESWKKVDEKTFYDYFNTDRWQFPFFSFSYFNNSEIYIKYKDSLFKIIPFLDSFKIEKSILNSINLPIAEVIHTKQEEVFILAIDSINNQNYSFSLYEFKSNQFIKLFSVNQVLINNHFAKMIKKDNTLVITIEGNVYIYNISTSNFQKVNYSLMNFCSIVDFINDSILFVSSYNDYLLYNLKTNNIVSIDLQTSNIFNYGTIHKSNDEFYSLNSNAITICKNLTPPINDETFLYSDYLFGAKNWKNQTWLFGSQNLYTNKVSISPNLAKEECITNLQIYPNPNNGIFKIFYQTLGNQTIEYCIYNDIGQLIECNSEKNNYGIYESNIDIQNLANGIYIIKIKSNCELKIIKIIKN
jgi:hypothetical protein